MVIRLKQYSKVLLSAVALITLLTGCVTTKSIDVMTTTKITSQKVVAMTKTEVYKEASTRFILHIDGYAQNNSMERCFAGGYKFNHIDVELLDTQKNETVFHYSNSGYSENCPPLSGTIFGDIANLTNSAWQ